MSIRSLLEINHDYAHQIEANPQRFMKALRNYLGSTDQRSVDEMERFGIVVFGSRHHADPFSAQTVAKLGRREGRDDRTDGRNIDAAAIAYVRDCLAIVGQELSDDEVAAVARKVGRALRAAKAKRPDKESGA